MVNVTKVKRKIILIGDGNVGKTSLVRRFVLDVFDDRYFLTIGSKVVKKRVTYQKDDNNMIELDMMIWDLMGQKEYIRTQQITFTGTHGALMVCDVTSKETLSNLEHWRNVLFDVTEEIPIVILANKNDLTDEAEISEEDLMNASKKFKAECYFTSAKTGENVDDAFRKIGGKLIK